jgi:hypothetical protein
MMKVCRFFMQRLIDHINHIDFVTKAVHIGLDPVFYGGARFLAG